MSFWYDVKKEDIDIDEKNKNINLYLGSDDNGSIYAQVELKAMQEKLEVLPIPTTEDSSEWLIWSIEHNGWWKPNERGYTPFILEAGRYNYQRALAIVKSANIHQRNEPNEAMIRIK